MRTCYTAHFMSSRFWSIIVHAAMTCGLPSAPRDTRPVSASAPSVQDAGTLQRWRHEKNTPYAFHAKLRGDINVIGWREVTPENVTPARPSHTTPLGSPSPQNRRVVSASPRRGSHRARPAHATRHHPRISSRARPWCFPPCHDAKRPMPPKPQSLVPVLRPTRRRRRI